MALHLYLDSGKLNQVSESAQTKLTQATTTGSTSLKVTSNAGIGTNDTVRLGEIQKIVSSISGSDTINLTTPIGAIFPVDTIVTKSNMQNPDTVTISGTVGGTDDRALYVANDAANKRYSNVQITTVNDSPQVDVQYALDNSGVPGTFSNTLTLPNITALGAGLDTVKIWRRVIISPGQESQEVVAIKHKITAIEYAVY
jgi:hypothetical protein